MRIKIKRWLMLLLILAMAGEAFAGGMTVTGQIKKHDDTNAIGSYRVECWDGAVVTSPTAPNYNAGAGTFSPSPPNAVTTKDNGQLCPAADPSTSGFYDPRSNKSVTIRVWEGADPAAVISTKGYYGYGSYSIGGESAPPGYTTQNVKANFKADKPDKPTVSAGGYNLAWNDAQQKFLVAFTLSASRGGGWESEAVSYTIRVRKPSDAYTAERTHAGASWGITETSIDNPYFIGGGTYVAQASASNPFGSTDGDEVTFTIPTGGAGGPVTFTYNLKKYEPTKLVVNSVTIPPNLMDDSGGRVTKASQLVSLINSRARTGLSIDRDIVIVIGKWDPATGNAVRYKAGGDGIDFDLEAGGGYQVYVTDDYTLTLQGTM